jgi:hypothetical protein
VHLKGMWRLFECADVFSRPLVLFYAMRGMTSSAFGTSSRGGQPSTTFGR